MNELISKIREYAKAQDLDKLVDAGFELEDMPHNTFEQRLVKETILNLIEDAYNGSREAYQAIIRNCDQF